MLLDEEGAVGFIDCGQVGRADRYLDLAVLAAEIVDRFGPAAVRVFARAYGIRRWNVSKAAYYADLYELF
jgi:aminoglycoside phosphotransferase